jgi:hypothetical protein
MATTKPSRPKRLCRTPDEAFEMGLADAVNDPPPTPAQTARLVVLLRPYLCRDNAA